MRTPGFHILALLLALAGAAPAAAQTVVAGRVLDDADVAPVAGTTVELLGRGDRPTAAARTDSAGGFHLVVQPGRYRMRVGRVGYRGVTTQQLTLVHRDSVEVEVRLDKEVVLMSPLTVVGRKYLNPHLQGFEERRRMGRGHFITREQIEERNAGRVSDLVTYAAGVRLTAPGRGSARGSRGVASMRGGGRCSAQIFVDGMLITRPGFDQSLDDYVDAEDVEGIEIYQGMQVPAEFQARGSECGTVVVWTRRGGRSARGAPAAAARDTAPEGGAPV
ncbi:MAG TPA: carboxypeptidase regulatory-like domain-containing protein [Longimicrobium sp.]|nr:carboxypeptidase regulatory-like domain-containing protein [Longimicrobium sp.]